MPPRREIDVRSSVADPVNDARQNVLGTINVAEAARAAGVRKIVFASSGGSIYGTPDDLPVAETAPVNPLSRTRSARCPASCTSTRSASSRPGVHESALANVYGPRQDPHGEAGVVAIFARALLAGDPTTIFGDGGNTRDYLYVGDVAAAFATAMGLAGNGGRYNIGTGAETSDVWLHGLVAAAAGHRSADGRACPAGRLRAPRWTRAWPLPNRAGGRRLWSPRAYGARWNTSGP